MIKTNYLIFINTNTFFLVSQAKSHLQYYPCPTNINFLWNFGFLLAITFVIQIVTGLLLASRYTSDCDYAFDSVQHIVREVSCGWQCRYVHTTGASAVFICLFMHMLRGLHGSYLYLPITWITGIIIFFITIITAFLGYVLPWGQMSFWGATVITNLLSPIPYLVTWIVGGFYVAHPTLKRFFVLHFVLPFVAMGIVILHIFYLHLQGSGNPLGNETDLKIPFYPHMLSIDMKGFNNLFFLFIIQAFLGILSLSHPDNSCPVNRFVTPLQIVPEWYYLSFYAILKVIPSKTGGLLFLVATQLLLLLYCENRASTTIIYLRHPFANRESSNIPVGYANCFLALLVIGAQLPMVVYIIYGRIYAVLYMLFSGISVDCPNRYMNRRVSSYRLCMDKVNYLLYQMWYPISRWVMNSTSNWLNKAR